MTNLVAGCQLCLRGEPHTHAVSRDPDNPTGEFKDRVLKATEIPRCPAHSNLSHGGLRGQCALRLGHDGDCRGEDAVLNSERSQVNDVRATAAPPFTRGSLGADPVRQTVQATAPVPAESPLPTAEEVQAATSVPVQGMFDAAQTALYDDLKKAGWLEPGELDQIRQDWAKQAQELGEVRNQRDSYAKEAAIVREKVRILTGHNQLLLVALDAQVASNRSILGVLQNPAAGRVQVVQSDRNPD